MKLRTMLMTMVVLALLPVAEAAAGRAKFRPAATAVSVTEGAGTATITIQKTKGSAGTISYSTRPGTATPGSDYTAVTGSVAFTGADTSKSFTIPILNDSIQEPVEAFEVVLRPSKGVTLANPRMRVSIVDDDGPARLSFESASENVSEQVGTHQVAVIRSGDTASTVGASFAVTGGSAPASDYSIGTASPLAFAAGETRKEIALTVADNAAADGDRTVQLGLSGFTSSDPAAALAAPTTSNVTILDDDVAPSIRFDPLTTWSASEGTGVLVISLERTGSTAAESSVVLQTSDITALVGSDYEAIDSDPVEFDPGERFATVGIGLIDDVLDESHETLSVTMQSATGAALIAPLGKTATIVDDDGAPTVSVGAPVTAPGAGGTTTVVFPIELSNPTTVDVTVDWEVRDVNGNVVASGQATIPAGQTSVTVTTPVTGSGPFTVSISNPTGGGATIEPGDGQGTTPGVQLGEVVTSPGGDGSGESSTTDVTFTVEVTNPGSQDITVDYEIRDVNGNVVASGQVTVPAGQTSVTVTVPVTGDGPFTVVISNPTGGATIPPGGGSAGTGTTGGGSSTGTGSGTGSRTDTTGAGGETTTAGSDATISGPPSSAPGAPNAAGSQSRPQDEEFILGRLLGSCRLTIALPRGQRVLRARGVRVRVTAGRACRGALRAHLGGRKARAGAKKSALKTRSTRIRLARGQSKMYTLRLSPRGLKLLRRSLGARRSVRAALLLRTVNAGRTSLHTLRWRARR